MTSKKKQNILVVDKAETIVATTNNEASTGIDVIKSETEVRLDNLEAFVEKTKKTYPAKAGQFSKQIKNIETKTEENKAALDKTIDTLTIIANTVSECVASDKELTDNLIEHMDTVAKMINDVKKSVEKSLDKVNKRLQMLEHPKVAVIEISGIEGEESFITPAASKDGSIGDDLYINKDIWVKHGRNVIPLNLRINLPSGIEGKIEPRSGFSAKGIWGKSVKYISDKVLWVFRKPAVEVTAEGYMDADVINGKIDPGYRESVGVILKNNGVPFMIPAGTKIAQITYYKTVEHAYKTVSEFSDDAPYVCDRNGGFGSSGK